MRITGRVKDGNGVTTTYQCAVKIHMSGETCDTGFQIQNLYADDSITFNNTDVTLHLSPRVFSRTGGDLSYEMSYSLPR